jgi:hydrogenase maturation protein HypF
MKIIDLPFKVKKPILACGADLKGAFALAKSDRAYLFEGFGDLGEVDNFARYEKAVKAQTKKLEIEPEVIACDLHPAYFSTQFAENLQLTTCRLRLFKIQHHEAHIASAITDNRLKGDVIGAAFDGAGYGTDGNIWGGEFFIGNIGKFKRAGHFSYMPMPGGDAAVMEPWRIAVSYLYKIFGRKLLDLKIDLIKKLDRHDVRIIEDMIDKKINSPLMSSAGRFFDAVGSIILSKKGAEFEAELPIALEKMALELCSDSYGFDIRLKDGMREIDFSKTVRGIVRGLSSGKSDPMTSASKFHNTVAEVIADMSAALKKAYKINKVVLSGGVFQNKFLAKRGRALLEKRGFSVYTNSTISTNDAGIPIGQIAIANARAACA